MDQRPLPHKCLFKGKTESWNHSCPEEGPLVSLMKQFPRGLQIKDQDAYISSSRPTLTTPPPFTSITRICKKIGEPGCCELTFCTFSCCFHCSVDYRGTKCKINSLALQHKRNYDLGWTQTQTSKSKVQYTYHKTVPPLKIVFYCFSVDYQGASCIFYLALSDQ